MRCAFVLCVSFVFWGLSATAQHSKVSASAEQQFNFFEIEFSFPLNTETKTALLEDYAALPYVANVQWVNAQTICLATQKGFVIEQVKPAVEKYHLSIETYREHFGSVSSSCLNPKKD
jgi:hypothetical protein